MATFTIFETGNMANAIGGVVVKSGASVDYIGSSEKTGA